MPGAPDYSRCFLRKGARGQPRGDDAVRRLAARRVPGHGGDEVVSLEREEAEVLYGAHRRGPRDVAEQRDLSEEVARAERRRLGTVDLDGGGSGGYQVEAVAPIALREHLG